MRGIIRLVSILGALACCSLASGSEPWARHVIDDALRGADGVKLADFNGDGRPEVVTGWEEGGQTRVYLHPAPELVRNRWPRVTVGRTPNVEDALPVDLNGDGAIDLVSLCEGGTRSVFVHWSDHRGDATALVQAARWRQESLTLPRMQWMFAAKAEGNAEDEVVLIAGGKGEGAFVGRIMATLAANVRDPMRARVRWQPLSPVGWVMSIVPMDVDGDGDQDVLLSDRRGPLRGVRWLENPLPDSDETGAWANHFIGGQDREVMFLTTADFDDDGLEDILVAAKPAGVLWFRRANASGGDWKIIEIAYPPGSGTAKAVAAGDLDRDGLSDLVVTCEAARDQLSGVWWFRSGNGEPFKNGIWHDVSGPAGTKYDLVELVDLDEDGDLDVLTCEESFQGRGLGVVWYENRLPEAGE